MEVLVCLAHTRDTKHKVQQDADHINRVCWGDPEKSLEVERVQLANQKLDEMSARMYISPCLIEKMTAAAFIQTR